jgi:hypothetical protein
MAASTLQQPSRGWLLDQLRGLEKDVLGDGEAERLRRLEVDHEVKGIS